MYTTKPHNLLIKVLPKIIHFVFKSKVRSKIEFSATSIYWSSKELGKTYFTEKSIIEAITFLIETCYFTTGYMVFKQDIGIPMDFDPAPFWANLLLYFFESKHVQNLISIKSTRAYKYHATSRFIDNLCIINDDNEFSKSYINAYIQEN